MPVDLYPHQRDAIDKLRNGNILWGDVGTGKSITAAAYYMENEAPKDVYVITTAKKRDGLDWEEEFIRFGVYKSRDATTAGVLRVDSWNNISKYKNVRDAFFIFDENRIIGEGEWAKAFVFIAKRNRWIILTATPGDTWLHYIAVMIANGFYKNRTEFKDEHVVYNTFVKFPKIDHYKNTAKLEKLRKSIIVHMPYERHTSRMVRYVSVDYDQSTFEKVWKSRWNVFKDAPVKSTMEMFYASRRVVNSDITRLDSLRRLMITHPRMIVFYNFDYELDMIRTLSDEIHISEWNGHNHHPIPEGDRWLYIVQYAAGAESWNCTTTDTMVFWSLTYSYIVWHQAHGRIDRLNTPFSVLHYYVFMSLSEIDKIVLDSLRQKKSFNETSYVLGLSVKSQ